MKNLSAKKLRKIIIEEMEKLIIQDDALFSRGDLTDTGTGAIVGLDMIDDEDDNLYYDDLDQTSQCSSCGGNHIDSDCGSSDEDEFVGYSLSNL